MAEQSRTSAFIEELRRRRVFRVAAFYGGIAFVIVQIIDGTFEVMGIPAWVSRLMITFLALGFPVAMGLAWIFDITPEGIVRTEGRSTGKPGTSNRALIAVTIAAVAFGVWGRWGGGGGKGDIRSIAVLPFTNLMNDSAQDYFVDGMTEALITELSKISALRVIGRTSTMHYKIAPPPISEIAAALDVDAIVEGSVLRAGDRVRITAQLVGTRPERHLWAEQYDREYGDILALHSEVAQAIAAKIKIKVTPEEAARFSRVQSTSAEAHQYYLKGLYFWNKRTSEDILTAREMFAGAIEADPLYARAYVGLADSYNLMTQYARVPASDTFPKAKAAARKALEINPDLAEAHISLAYTAQQYDWDLPLAENEFALALALNPSYATGHQWHAEFLAIHGRFAEARTAVNTAKSIDPISPVILTVSSFIYYWNHEFQLAIEEANEALDLQPVFPLASHLIARAYFTQGKYEEWLEQLESDPQRYGPNLADVSQLRRIWSQQGLDGLLKDASVIEYIMGGRRSVYYAQALYGSLAGTPEETLAALEAGYEDRVSGMLFLVIADPGIRDQLQGDPRYHDLLRRMGLER